MNKLFILFIAINIFLVASCNNDSVTRVVTAAATRTSITEVVSADGKLYPESEVKISPDMPGEITELEVGEGDSVKKGQVLVRLSQSFGKTSITAPMAGIVTSLNVKKGERVAGNNFNVGTEMMRIADMSSMELRVEVVENDIIKVDVGDSADVIVDAYDNRKFKGIVTQIANNTGKGSMGAALGGGGDIAGYEVRIRVNSSSYSDLIDPQKPRRMPFRSGMNARAEIKVTTKQNVIGVPIAAVAARIKGSDKTIADQKREDRKTSDADAESSTITEGNTEEVVFVINKDGQAEKRTVTTGIQDINHIEIISGLQGNEQVVVAPNDALNRTLRSGTKVKVVSRDQLFSR